jgi:hypothetical protein
VLRVGYLSYDDSLGRKSDYYLPDKIRMGLLPHFKFAATTSYKIISEFRTSVCKCKS